MRTISLDEQSHHIAVGRLIFDTNLNSSINKCANAIRTLINNSNCNQRVLIESHFPSPLANNGNDQIHINGISNSFIGICDGNTDERVLFGSWLTVKISIDMVNLYIVPWKQFSSFVHNQQLVRISTHCWNFVSLQRNIFTTFC